MMDDRVLQFPGMWKISGRKPECGVLYCNDVARTIRLKIQSYYPWGTDRDFEWPRDKDLGPIIGNVGIDGKMTLLGCRPMQLTGDKARGGHVSELEIEVNYAFRDYKLGKSCKVAMKGVSVDFGEILAWTRTSAYQMDMSKTGDDFFLHRWRSIEFGYKFPLPEHGEVAFTPYASYPGAVEISRKVVLSQGVRTSLHYKTSQNWNVIKDDIELVRHLVEFAMSSNVGIIEASFSRPRDKWLRKSLEPKTYEQIVFGDKIVGETKKPRDGDLVFTLPELMAVINKSKAKWRKAFGDLRLALRLYDEIIRKEDEGIEMTFVRIVQLLEHLHSLRYSDRSVAYYKRMCEVWGDDESMVCEERRRLCGTRNPDRPTLKMRIYEMTRTNGKWLVRNPIGGDGIAFAEMVANTRHYFTHHNTTDKVKAFEKDKLEDVFYFLRSLVRYHVLIKMGFSEGFALRRMGWSNESSRELFSIMHNPIGEEKINV